MISKAYFNFNFGKMQRLRFRDTTVALPIVTLDDNGDVVTDYKLVEKPVRRRNSLMMHPPLYNPPKEL